MRFAEPQLKKVLFLQPRRVRVTGVQEHSCLVGLCSATSLHPSVRGPALCLPGTAFVFGIVVFCINPELVLCGKVAHPHCANREELHHFSVDSWDFLLYYSRLSLWFSRCIFCLLCTTQYKTAH